MGAFPPTLLQHESLGYRNAPGVDARPKMQRGAERGRGTAPLRCRGDGELQRRGRHTRLHKLA